MSDAEVFGGVKKYIYTHAQKSSDKKFHVQSGGKDVALDLITIHADRLSDLGGDKHFVCVDMKGANGATYDVDFFITVRSAEPRHWLQAIDFLASRRKTFPFEEMISKSYTLDQINEAMAAMASYSAAGHSA